MSLGQHSAAIGILVTFCFGALVCDLRQACIAGAILAVATFLAADRKDGA